MFAAAAIVPLLLFFIFQTGFTAREQRRSVELQALAKSESVLLRVDAITSRVTAAMDAAATLPLLQERRTAEALARVRELGRLSKSWSAVQLLDRTGAVVAADGPQPGRIERIEPFAPRARPRHVGYAWGERCPCIVFERNALGEPGSILRFFLPNAEFAAQLPATTSTYPVSAIVGPKGRFIARSVAGAERFGALSSTYVRGAISSDRTSGLYRGVTLEGFENYSAFTRSAQTGWSAHIAMGTDYIDAPRRNFLGSIGLAALLSVALAGALLLFAIRQLRESRQMAESAQQSHRLEALGQLTGGIAHDFNNLLTPIVGALDYLKSRGGLDERARRIAGGALLSANRASRLTAQLLAFSRRQKLAIDCVPLAQSIEDLRPILEQTIGTDHRLEIALPADVGGVRTDAHQLELAILNLVINARDASPAGSVIALEVEAFTVMTAIRIRDSGSGMSDAVRARAFEPFFTTKEPGRGTGLGLAQVFALMKQSHGTVGIDSAPGKGTAITLRLPRCELPETPASDSGPTVRAPSRVLRLLVVDDDHAVRSSVARSLEDEGHSVDAVADGRVAIAAVTHCDYDLLLVDFAMPVIDGAATIREIRAFKPDQRFLMITGFADSEAIDSSCPDVPVLRKPFTMAELAERVRDLTA